MSSKPRVEAKKPSASLKTRSSSNKIPKKDKGKQKAISIPLALSSNEPSENEDEASGSEEDGDAIERGMNHLMNLLGEDGLDEEAQYQLGLMSKMDEDEESGEEDDGDAILSDADAQSEDPDVEEEDNDDTVAQAMEEVDLEDVSSVDDDAVPKQKIVINHKAALERIRETFKLDPSLPWTETLAVTYDQAIEVGADDDLNRELAFYKQALHGAKTARTLAEKHKLPFTRPSDFYAEMVKSDSHMERIRQRLVDESATIKRGEEKKREREGKKFGKKVQVEKLKERERTKKDMEERIRGLKRKRKDALDGDGEEFDVQLEDALSERPAKRQHRVGGAGKGSGNTSMPRTKRDAKFGFGGKVGRRAKQNTRDSTDAVGFGGGKKFGGGKGKKLPPKRLGKSRRMKSSGK